MEKVSPRNVLQPNQKVKMAIDRDNERPKPQLRHPIKGKDSSSIPRLRSQDSFIPYLAVTCQHLPIKNFLLLAQPFGGMHLLSTANFLLLGWPCRRRQAGADQLVNIYDTSHLAG